jgi:polysaccharide pyruvyl transferase WcaK-like protein
MKSADEDMSLSCSPQRVAIAVGAGINNHGNDASLEALLSSLKRISPNSVFSCICHRPEKIEPRYGIPSVPLHWDTPKSFLFRAADRFSFRILSHLYRWRKTYLFLSKIDLLLFSGTGLLDDFDEHPLGMPYRIFMWCACAKIRRIRIAMVSIGAGPIKNPLSRFFMVKSAKLAEYRSYRDGMSKNFLQSTGMDTREDPVYADLVFSLPLDLKQSLNPPSSDGSMKIGIGLMNYYGWAAQHETARDIHESYVNRTFELVSALLERQHRVVFLVGIGEEKVVEHIQRRFLAPFSTSHDDRVCIKTSRNFQEQAKYILHLDVLIGSRYHTVIAGLMQNCAVIALGYTDKFSELMNCVGLNPYCQNIETFQVDRTIGLVEDAIKDRAYISQMLSDKNKILRDILATQETALAKQFFRARKKAS